MKQIHKSTLSLVEKAEKVCHSASKRELIQSEYKHLPFNDKVWQAFWVNTTGLRGVLRKTGGPYSTHPTEAALIGYYVLGPIDKEIAHSTAAICLLHDYLEEGEGFSAQSFKRLKKSVTLSVDSARGAVILSEPDIDYSMYEYPTRIMEYIAYIEQIKCVSSKLNICFFNSVFLDKIHNGHHWAYIVKNSSMTKEQKSKKLTLKLAYYQYVVDQIGEHADPKFVGIVRDLIQHYSGEFGIAQPLMDQGLKKLNDISTKHKSQLKPQIHRYHELIGVWE